MVAFQVIDPSSILGHRNTIFIKCNDLTSEKMSTDIHKPSDDDLTVMYF